MLKFRVTHRRTLCGVAATLALSLLATGCGGGASEAKLVDGSWDEVVEAAKEEGRVVFYTGTSEGQANRVVEVFNEKYPEIEVEVVRGASDIVARTEAEMKAGTDGADVFIHADPQWFRTWEDDLLPAEGPGTEGLHEDAWVVEDKAVTAHGSPYSMFVWNTDIFPEGFGNWDDFLEPAVEGKLAMRGDASKSAIGFMEFLETEVGQEYMKKVGQTGPKLYPSVVPMTQAVASGEVGVTMASLPSLVKELQESGAPIDFTYPEPAYGIGFVTGALENAHRPNAAVVFNDFLLSPAGQEALNGDGYGTAARDGVPGAIDPSTYTWLDSAKYTPEVVAQWEAKISDYF
jgi:iron(III) transport system substrate-binding protein